MLCLYADGETFNEHATKYRKEFGLNRNFLAPGTISKLLISLVRICYYTILLNSRIQMSNSPIRISTRFSLVTEQLQQMNYKDIENGLLTCQSGSQECVKKKASAFERKH